MTRLRRRTIGVPFRGPVIETGTWTRRITAALAVIAVGYLVFQLIFSLFQALNHAIAFNGYALDGAFQLYNPLRRMAAGEIPAEQFPFFHGIGIPWLHYPFFALLGENIFASEFTRWILSPVLFVLSGMLFSRAVLGTWARASIATALLFAVCSVGNDAIVDAGNSMLGLRAMTPLLIAAAMLWPVKRYRTAFGFLQWHTSLLIAYALIGVAVALGTEQGVAAAGAFLLVRAVQNLRRLAISWRLVVQVLADTLAVAVSVVGILSVLSLGHPLDALVYALRDVPADQGWVFGSLPNISLTPDALAWELRGGPTLDLAGIVPGYWLTIVASLVLVGLGIWLRVVRRVDLEVYVFLWIYGTAVLVSLIGYIYLSAQLAPMARAAAAIACAVGVQIAVTLLARGEAMLRSRPTAHIRPSFAVGAIATIAAVVIVIPFVVDSAATRAAALAEMPKRALLAQAWNAPSQTDREVAGEGYKGALAAFDPYIPEGASIWATYTSLYSSDRGVFTPAPGGEDYTIHALGPRRDVYEAAFASERPDVVITTNPDYTIYEEWLWGRWPGFFEQLVTNYRIAAVNGSHVLWERLDDREPEGARTVLPIAADGSFELPGNDDDRVRYYALTVDYAADGGGVPVLNRLPRFYLQMPDAALTLWGQVLPDNHDTWSLVVPVFPGQGPVRVSPAISGYAPNASLELSGASYGVLSVDPSVDDLILRNFCTGGRDDERCDG